MNSNTAAGIIEKATSAQSLATLLNVIKTQSDSPEQHLGLAVEKGREFGMLESEIRLILTPDLSAKNATRAEVDSVTELQVAQAVAARRKGQIHFVPEQDSFVVFDEASRVWNKDSGGAIAREILAVLAEVKERGIEQARHGSDKGAKVIAATLRAERSSFVEGAARLLKALPGITMHQEFFDSDPLLVGLKSGEVLDLRSAKVRPMVAGDYVTRTLNAPFDIAAGCPRFLEFLEQVQPNPAIRRYIQKSLGYSLSGLTEVQSVNFAYGLGANGKSVLLGLWLWLMGGYGRMLPSETLMDRGADAGVPNDVATLVGVRFALANELPDGRKWAETLLKQLSGGDRMVARYLFREYFEFTPRAKIWVAGNHKPFVSGSDYGFWRRLALVLFGVTIPEAERDAKLFEKMQKEASGILNWGIEGWKLYQQEGLSLPDEIRKETASYQADSDIVGQFLEAECEAGDYEITASSLYSSFRYWCEENGFHKMTANSFGRKLSERGISDEKRGGIKYRRGIRLRRGG